MTAEDTDYEGMDLFLMMDSRSVEEEFNIAPKHLLPKTTRRKPRKDKMEILFRCIYRDKDGKQWHGLASPFKADLHDRVPFYFQRGSDVCKRSVKRSSLSLLTPCRQSPPRNKKSKN